MVAKAIQLIHEKNSNLVLNPEGLDALKAIRQDFGVCVCVGSLFNIFNRIKSGF
jgi:hypothetical protein